VQLLCNKEKLAMSNAEIFRVHADECQWMARFTHDEDRKRQWLDMERRWRDLIERDEAQHIRHDVSETNLAVSRRTFVRRDKYAKRKSNCDMRQLKRRAARRG
jgi:hypothetical protein